MKLRCLIWNKNNILHFVSEVLTSERNCRNIKNNLNSCEDAILDLIDLTVKISDMVVLEKHGILQEKKLYDNGLLFSNKKDVEYSYNSLIKYDDFDVLTEVSDTGEVFGFRKM